jgi:transcriptional regulator with XRE-family HTH domain
MNIFDPEHSLRRIEPVPFTTEDSDLATRRGATTEQGMMAIAERIAELRKNARLTQSQLAEQIGVSQPVISAIERGELRVHGELIIELAKLFKVTADDILGLKPPKKNPNDKMSPEMKRLWIKFQQIAEWPEKDQRAVIRLINSVSKSAC